VSVDLWVRKLKLTSYRNYSSANIQLDARPVVLVGQNGAGKTNMMEAISYLSPGRGMRSAGLDKLQNTSETIQGWSVFADLETAKGPVQVGTGIESPDRTRDRISKRIVRINGEAATGQAELRQHLSVSWMTPQMDRLFVDTASERRRFLDRLVYGFNKGHARAVSQYDHARSERLKLLKEGRGDATWLDTLEQRLWQFGQQIYQSRQNALEALQPFCLERLGPFPTANLLLESDCHMENEGQFLAKMAQNRLIDGRSGTTIYGVHKTDLSVIHVEKKTQANQCSTGEQKALLIALILANARALAKIQGVGPLLLLDEVAAHLDEERRNSLFQEILALNAQTWMTGTEQEPFAGLTDQAQFIEIAAGEIKQQKDKHLSLVEKRYGESSG